MEPPGRTGWPVLIVLVLLVFVGAVGWLVYLTISPPPQQPVTGLVEPAPTPSQTGGADESEPSDNKELDAWLRVQARALSLNTDEWGDPRHDWAVSTAAEADEAYRRGLYTDGAILYNQAATAMASLIAERDTLLNNRLAKAQQALGQEDGAAATLLFTQALAIDPDNEQAKRGAARASVLGMVVSQYNAAQNLEQSGALAEAAEAYRAIIALDPSYQPAAEGFARVNGQLTEIRFQQALGLGLRSLENNQLEPAENYLNEAAALNPVHPALSQARTQLTIAAQKASLIADKTRAESYVKTEQWRRAGELYEQILSTTPDLSFALIGKEMAATRATLDDALQDIIERSNRLSDETVLRSARLVLSQAQAVNNPGPRLKEQIARAEALIQQAGAEVRVVLSSDGLTTVTVYRVGSLGTFTTMELSLRPGIYTMVGSRPGYRDVRHQLQATHDNAITLDIRCREKI
jgi:tetratricopeptide (TPR) repeat protein